MMNRRPNGWSAPTLRTHEHLLLHQNGRPSKKFLSSGMMPTSQTLVSSARQTHDQSHVYLTEPPENEQMFEARVIIAAEHLVPSGLDRSGLDNICLNNHVWITRINPLAFDISSRTMRDLRKATEELNWLIYDLRLRESTTSGSTHSTDTIKGVLDDTEVESAVLENAASDDSAANGDLVT